MEESKKEISHEDGSEVTRELPSQKLREMSPELDPLRIGTGWTPEELSKPQIFIESTFGDSHPGSGPTRADTERGTSRRICATARARERTGSTIRSRAVK